MRNRERKPTKVSDKIVIIASQFISLVHVIQQYISYMQCTYVDTYIQLRRGEVKITSIQK